MVRDLSTLDAHEQPAPELKAIWKGFSRTEQEELLKSSEIDDPRDPRQANDFAVAGVIPAGDIEKAWEFIGYKAERKPEDARILYHPLVPGLLIVPGLIPVEAQRIILDNTVHRDLVKPEHQTNLHLHYNIPYPPNSESFFTYPPETATRFTPKDPSVHKPLSLTQVLNRRLSWMTLGGQFDWTNRVYPGTLPPSFPQDLGSFLHSLFPQTVAQAAIVNFYTPGDTMMMHRDVSEKTDRGLVSLSVGCDSLFMIAPNGVDWEAVARDRAEGKTDKKFVLLRIRSGDVVYMTEESRYAWHGVPKVFKDTCPEELQDWPAKASTQEEGYSDKYEQWRGWLKNKRVNINVRQME